MEDYNYEKYHELKEQYYKEHPTYNGEVNYDRERYIDDALKWRATYEGHRSYGEDMGF